MKITFLTIFPGIIRGYIEESIMDKAVSQGLLTCDIVNIRDFAYDKHKKCDDYPYGGGAGMVFKPEPIAKALETVLTPASRVIYPSPSGKVFHQETAVNLAEEKHLVFICGRYEGIDQRIIDEYVDDEYSVGDYILSSGEIAALVIADTVYRLVDGVINPQSLEEESFTGGFLEYPHYTRPEIFNNMRVPDVLLSGHHAEIQKWRFEQQVRKTLQNRPDLLENRSFPDEVKKIITMIMKDKEGENLQ